MIYTIASSSSFSDALARKWLSEKKDDVWGLSHITAILPTNRATRTFKEAFLRQSQGQTILLPKILSFADMDFLAPDVPPAISPLARQLLLAELIERKQSMSPDKAFVLAADLAELIDEMHHYDVSFESLKEIAPDNFANHWQQTLSFLEIIQTFWPQILAERGELDPSLRQIRLVEKTIDRWRENPPSHPVVAVGFSAGLPIIERFLKAINELPQSDIYIPNLDKNLSKEDWEKLDPEHPEFYIKRLLDKMDVRRSDVASFEDSSDRFALLSTALKPACATDTWPQEARKLTPSCVQNLSLIECKTPQSEAFEIASLLRGVLETPGKTAALVTPDRNLARRVRTQMKKWDIELDDSAGTPLTRTPVGTFLILLAEAAVSQKSSDLLALLKHPLTLDGRDFTAFRKEVHQAEQKARAQKQPFQMNLNTDLTPLMNLFINPVRVPFDILLRTHLDVAQRLATSADKTGAERLWDKESGDAASALLTEVLTYADVIGDIEPITYPAFLTALLNSVTVRPKYGMHPRLDILGPIEARLQQPDLVIIAGLNEGTFPQLPQTDAWINRPMRAACGLPALEEKIGVAAQDFMHLMQAPEVILTRSLKVDGTPSIPSRWLSRLQAVLEAAKISMPTGTEQFAPVALRVEHVTPTARPEPTPPVTARPKTLSISDVCMFINDPYGVYAKRVLGLYKLDDLDAGTTVAEFGLAVHEALAAFLSLPRADRTFDTLLRLGEKGFENQRINPTENPFFWQKFERIAAWFIDEMNTDIVPQKTLLEVEGKLEFPIGTDVFTLKGRADRIDILPDNYASLIDYKTGAAPTKSQVVAGFAPQLPIEAIMLKAGCFTEGKGAKITDLAYWRLMGKETAGQIFHVAPDEKQIPMDDFLKKIWDGILRMLALYQDPRTPYPACPKPARIPKYNDYAHLERVAEWQIDESEEE